MDTLRQRIPFKFSDSPDDHDEHILDEQEQEEIITKLRRENRSSSQQYLLLLQTILALSVLLHLLYIFSPSRDSPLLALIPTQHPDPDPPIPLPTVLSFIALLLHGNLLLLLNPNFLRVRLNVTELDFRGLPYSMSYALSAVAPTLCVFLGRSWQAVAWWSVTGGMIFLAQSVQGAIDDSAESISELESMRYVAPGA